MSALLEVRRRANLILCSTSLLDDLGLTAVGADTRALARAALDLADELETERSSRISIQAARDNAIAILERQAGEALAAARRR
jgi:hypothetical protein